MVDNRKPQKTRYQGVAYVIGGNSYRGRKAFLVAGFVLPAHSLPGNYQLACNSMEHLLNKIKFLCKPTLGKISIAVFAVIAISGGGYYYWTGTPQYALSQIKTAYQTHDVDLAMKYIDFDAVFDDMWSQMDSKLAAQTASQNSWEKLGTVIGQGIAQNMKPTIKEKVHDELVRSVRETDSTSNLAQVMKSPVIEHQGVLVYVYGSGPLKFEMQKEGHYWRVVAIPGILDQ